MTLMRPNLKPLQARKTSLVPYNFEALRDLDNHEVADDKLFQGVGRGKGEILQVRNCEESLARECDFGKAGKLTQVSIFFPGQVRLCLTTPKLRPLSRKLDRHEPFAQIRRIFGLHVCHEVWPSNFAPAVVGAEYAVLVPE